MIPPKEFIRKIRPFSFLSENELDILVSALDVELFEKDKIIYKKGQISGYVYVIFSGVVGLFDDEVVDYLSKGEVFGIKSMYGIPLKFTVKTMEDTVCYLVAAKQFKAILDANERFASFFSTFINRSFRSFRSVASDKKILEEASFVLDVERIIYKKPVVCNDKTTLASAAAEMDKNAISSIIVIDDDIKPIGILTHKDLRKVIMRGDKSDPIAKFMSSPVKTITARTTIFDAFTKMIDNGIDHLVVIKEGKVFGVITRKDIQIHLEPPFSIVKLFRKVRKAASIDELKTIFDGLKLSISKIAMTGPNFFDLTKILCSVHDAVVGKVIEMLSDGHPGDQFAWIHMGSSGRKEEIIATDQDNALICRGGNLEALAGNVNEALAGIGFPKCPGNYMASNSRWNQPQSVWKEYFRQWFADPVPDHIRYLSIFLDMRPVYGEPALYDEMLEAIKPMVTKKAVMLLAQDAIEIRPPLGVLGIIGLRKGVDLKTYGIYPIANGARVLALDNGIFGITNTKERLEALNADMTISDEMCHDLIESYGFLQDLRLRHHARAVLNQSQANNLVTGKELEKIDLVLLKESLKIVSEFQKFLMKKYDVRRTIIYSQL